MNASTIPTANTRMMVNMLLKFDVDTPKWSRLKGVSFLTGIIWGPGFWVLPKASHFSNPTGYVEQGDRARAMLSRTVNSSQERFQVLVSWSILFWKFNMDQRSYTEVVSEVFPVLDWRCLLFPVLCLFWKYTVPQKFNMDPENWPS